CAKGGWWGDYPPSDWLDVW
nr:immunoglobulin heavy chain junction region [Macaca mulatta]MOX59322.1 immunoglobulin heavy chain junction region [Macaca mulatta]MOX59631.1 immunoglobulin heavy chain junction region [Macaca mulatta]MOX59711.1 immunoglobulin heavy chain junction region [Macaca mulatta]MOX59720.1 immunoglobulin heavy chain junction region [Macaca mulatta]